MTYKELNILIVKLLQENQLYEPCNDELIRKFAVDIMLSQLHKDFKKELCLAK